MQRNKDIRLYAAAIAVAISLPAIPAQAESGKASGGSIVYYDTSGGSIATALKSSIFKNFTNRTGISIIDDFNDGDTKFFAAEKAGQMPWSVIAFNTVADGLRAEKQGLLLPIDKKEVPLSKLGEGSHDNYGIKGIIYGFVLTWNTKKWPLSGPHPSSWADFYNTQKFPGKRCLYKGAQSGWTLESALLADGVSPSQLYPLDVPRALKKLHTIKNDIVWWTSGAQSIQLFETGECNMGITWSARPWAAITQDHAPLAISWHQAGYTSDMLAVPKGAPNPSAGQKFLAHWITDHQGQIDFVNQTGYPTNITGLSVGDYAKGVQPYLAAGTQLQQAIQEDDSYYEKNLQSVTQQFMQWLVTP
jgi:putative spermidine/putrescine transport system substrate-binding protein